MEPTKPEAEDGAKKKFLSLKLVGSAECDQFFISEDEFDTRRPILLNYFTENSISIAKICCGALHTLALSDAGNVYSWGCNDDYALGCKPQKVGTPELVQLGHKVDLISAGDSHSLAANSVNGILYFWGVYRDISKGNMAVQVQEPKRIGEHIFTPKKPIEKILSGANHSMVLSAGRIYTWGDSDTGVLGRMPLPRHKYQQNLNIESLSIKNVVDIYTGGNHAFAKTRGARKGKNPKEDYSKVEDIYAWGLNNYGQLGIGNKENTIHPTKVAALCGLSEEQLVIDIKGGMHHSICLLGDGTVAGWGRNDDGQIGLPKDFSTENDESQSNISKSHATGLDEEAKEAESVTRPSTQVDKKKQNEFLEPVKVPNLSSVERIFSSSHFCYAITKDNKVYSWGEGTSYVCLNGKDDSVYGPFKVSEKILGFEKVRDLGLGSSHVVILSGPADLPTPQLSEDVREKLKMSVLRKAGGKIPINIMDVSPISVTPKLSF